MLVKIGIMVLVAIGFYISVIAIAQESASAAEEIHAEIKAMQAEIEGLVALVDNGQKQHCPQASLPGAALTGRPAREDHGGQNVPI